MGGAGQTITVRFKTFGGPTIRTTCYQANYKVVHPWTWNTWNNNITRPSFAGSTLRIDNYETSLYMGTVQGYIQGLEQGSIQQDCTFIDIRASATTWDSGEQALIRKVTYQAPNGKYYTTVTKIQGDIYGTGPKEIEFRVFEGTFPFNEAILMISVTVTVYALFAYIGVSPAGPMYLYVSGTDVVKFGLAFVSGSVEGIVRAAFGWSLKVGASSQAVMAYLSGMGAGGVLLLLILKASVIGFAFFVLTYIICQAFGLPKSVSFQIAVGIGIAVTGAAMMIIMANGGGLGITAAMLAPLLALGPVGWIVVGIIIVVGVIIAVAAYLNYAAHG